MRVQLHGVTVQLYLRQYFQVQADISEFAYARCGEGAPVMNSFQPCCGPGAAKWYYTAGYFRGLSEEAQPVQEARSQEH